MSLLSVPLAPKEMPDEDAGSKVGFHIRQPPSGRDQDAQRQEAGHQDSAKECVRPAEPVTPEFEYPSFRPTRLDHPDRGGAAKGRVCRQAKGLTGGGVLDGLWARTQANADMKPRPVILISLLTTLLMLGCAAPRTTQGEFSDPNRLKQVFAESVREFYNGRTDGKLTGPSDLGSVMRFVFTYNEPRDAHVDGQQRQSNEAVNLSYKQTRLTSESSPMVRKRIAHAEWVDLVIDWRGSKWKIDLHQPVSGQDPVLSEEGKRISGLMKTKLGQP